ncbi:MAG TPA: flippase-like domain-containing protein [Methanosarcinaceae archaeon]|nr:flippase-like domain-containing protein [Methanosarcinaceae archaeon]
MKLGNILFSARLIGAIIILWLIDVEQLTLILRSIDPYFILLAFLLELSGFLIWTLKWKHLVDKIEHIKFTTLFMGLLAGNCMSTNVLRARTLGGFGRVFFLKNVSQNHKNANWYATIAMDQTTNNFVFAPLIIFSLLFGFLFLNIPGWLSVLMEIIVLILFSSALAAYLSRQKIKRLSIINFCQLNLQRIYNFTPIKFFRDRFESYHIFEEIVVHNLTEFKKTYTSILKDKQILAKDVSLAVLMYSFIYSKSYVLFHSTGYDISILQLVVSLSLILWIISVVPVPGGFGFKTIVTIGMYTMVGVPINIAAIVSVIDRIIYLFFVSVVSYSAIGIMRIFHIKSKPLEEQ